MLYRGCLFGILAYTTFTYAVKVNMHGSLSLGKEVMDTISHFLMSGYSMSGRRSVGKENSQSEDAIPPEVITASLCKKLEFCINGMETFVNEYVTSLGKAIEDVFEGIFSEKVKQNSNNTESIFTRLQDSLHDARKILKAANGKISEDKEPYIWLGVVKVLSSLFQRKSITYIIDGLEADKSVIEIKKKLTQKLVVSIAAAEARAEKRLCKAHHMCFKSMECTISLNTILKKLNTAPDDRIKKFMKAFYEALLSTHFYTRLEQVTANEFRDILNDMAYFDNVPSKDILQKFQQTVELRINNVDSDADTEYGQDVQLVHIILSDMDYIYGRAKGDPFGGFVSHLTDWTKTGGKISSRVKDIVRNIEDQLKDTSDDIVVKLIDEVRVFLEITVDP